MLNPSHAGDHVSLTFENSQATYELGVTVIEDRVQTLVEHAIESPFTH